MYGFTYPDGYYCNPPNVNDPNLTPYDRAFLFVNVWNDLSFIAGPAAYRSIVDSIKDDRFQQANVSMSPECLNTFDYDTQLCQYVPPNYYQVSNMHADPYNNPELALTYEVAYAWHNRIRDWYVVTDPNNCHGKYQPISQSDPKVDYAPWFDDAPNDTFLAWFIPMDTYGVHQPDGSIVYGPFAESPATCTNEYGTNCKPFSLDYPQDRDKFIFIGRKNKEYWIYTTPGDDSDRGTDTIIKILDADGSEIAYNDDCDDSDIPVYSHLYSCLRFKPENTKPYRIEVLSYPGAYTGSRAIYKLHVEMKGDDYGDSKDTASPLPPRKFIIGSFDAWDLDAFYQVITSDNQDLSVSVVPDTNSESVLVWITDQEGHNLKTECIDSARDYTFSGLAKGTYFVYVGSCFGTTGGYYLWADNTSKPGSTQDTAFDIYDPKVEYPLPTRILPGYISDASTPEYVKFYAHKGEIVIIDAFASSGAVSLRVEPDTRDPLTSQETPSKDRVMHKTWVINGSSSSVNTFIPRVFRHYSKYAWSTLIEDMHGGVFREGDIPRNSHITFTAPWNGYYFIQIKARQNYTGFVLYVAGGVSWTDYPDEP